MQSQGASLEAEDFVWSTFSLSVVNNINHTQVTP